MDSHSLSLPWLLIAAPQLNDPNFKRAVVLIVEHSDEGSMGFVINRPLQTSLASVIEYKTVEIPENIPVWYGGPVATGNGVIMHTPPEAAPPTRSPAQIVLTASDDSLNELIVRSDELFGDLQDRQRAGASALVQPLHDKAGLPNELYPYRFIVGYSGWGAGQLEEEIREGVWLEIPSTQHLVFGCPWNQMWDEAYATIGIAPRGFAPGANTFLN
jgi:putative transcriptional regulator